MVLRQVLLVLVLVLANGVFAMAEFAIVSSRNERLQQRAREGNRGARRALRLAGDLDRFLSTVQVGVSLVGVFAGAVGGVALSAPVAEWLGHWAPLAPYAQSIAIVAVVLTITYLTLVLGELVPKRIALTDPERVAAVLSWPMEAMAAVTKPIVWMLGASTSLMLRILRVREEDRPPVTEDEIRALLQQGTDAGVIEEVEQDMVESVFRLNDRAASALMTPRPEVVWLDLDDSPEELRQAIMEKPFSRFPVGRESLEQLLGEVKAKDLLIQAWKGETFDLEAVVHQPLYVPDIMPALTVLEQFKLSGTQLAMVIDEYGSVEGVLTLTDILEAIVGDIPAQDQPEEPQIIERDDGSWLVDGMLTTDEFRYFWDLEESLPGEDQGLFQTLAGFTVMQLGRVPASADSFEWEGLRFEIVDMDGPRVDKLLISRIGALGDKPAVAPGLASEVD
ncbi:MAG: HlyC/CorC family transporter [Chloroflexi bacterium]|nr:HlyC/CorC family transporter [Chloroflexota bacterium]